MLPDPRIVTPRDLRGFVSERVKCYPRGDVREEITGSIGRHLLSQRPFLAQSPEACIGSREEYRRARESGALRGSLRNGDVRMADGELCTLDIPPRESPAKFVDIAPCGQVWLRCRRGDPSKREAGCIGWHEPALAPILTAWRDPAEDIVIIGNRAEYKAGRRSGAVFGPLRTGDAIGTAGEHSAAWRSRRERNGSRTTAPRRPPGNRRARNRNK